MSPEQARGQTVYKRRDIGDVRNTIRDVAPLAGTVTGGASTQLHVVLNWFDELERLVPSDG